MLLRFAQWLRVRIMWVVCAFRPSWTFIVFLGLKGGRIGRGLNIFSCPCTISRSGRKCLDTERMGYSRLRFRKIVIFIFTGLVALVISGLWNSSSSFSPYSQALSSSCPILCSPSFSLFFPLSFLAHSLSFASRGFGSRSWSCFSCWKDCERWVWNGVGWDFYLRGVMLDGLIICWWFS